MEEVKPRAYKCKNILTDDVNNPLVASLLYVHSAVIVDMNSEWLKCGLPFPSSSKSTLLNSIHKLQSMKEIRIE